MAAPPLVDQNSFFGSNGALVRYAGHIADVASAVDSVYPGLLEQLLEQIMSEVGASAMVAAYNGIQLIRAQYKRMPGVRLPFRRTRRYAVIPSAHRRKLRRSGADQFYSWE